MWHSLVVSVGVLVLYLMFGQDHFYKADGHGLVLKLGQGAWEHYAHFLYLPVLHTIKVILGPLGLSDYRVACAASAIGSALGVFCFHRAAARLGLDRLDALLVVLLVALAPSVVFFATVVEIHGVFLGFVGLAWWAAVRLSVAPSLPAAALLGSATALAAFVHGSGHLMPAVLFPWLLARRADSLGRNLACLGVAALVHAGLVVLLPVVLSWFGIQAPVSSLVEYTKSFLDDPPGISVVPRTLFQDWLLAFLPISVLWLPALFERGRRWTALAFLASLMIYLGVTTILLRGVGERGAYEAPLAFSAALLTAAAFRRPVLVVAVTLSLVVSLASVIEHNRPKGDARYASDLSAAVDIEKAYVILGTAGELDPVLRAGVKLDFFLITDSVELLANAKDEDQQRSLLALFDEMLATKTREGKSIYLSEGASRVLAEDSDATRALTQHLEETYEFEVVERGSFRANRLRKYR